MTYIVHEFENIIFYTKDITEFADYYMEDARFKDEVVSTNNLVCRNDKFKQAADLYYKYELDAAATSYSQHKWLSKIADNLKKEQFETMCIILRTAFVDEITKGSGEVRINERTYCLLGE